MSPKSSSSASNQPIDPAAEQIELKVELTGLIEIFGEALYQDFGSVVRELTQNGHDAIIEHCASLQDPEMALLEHQLDVIYNEYSQELVISDNGVGMTRSQLIKNLNNFAKSDKRSIQKQLADNQISAEGVRLLQIVGQYGVGFLSAMAVSNQVEVWSKIENDVPFCWKYDAGKVEAQIYASDVAAFSKTLSRFNLNKRHHGTVVICHLSDRIYEQYCVDEEEVRESITRYAALLPVPIYFNGEKISCKHESWENPLAASEAAWKDAISDIRGENPLTIIPVYSPPEELDVQGVLWIPEKTSYFSTPAVDVYVKRMFVLTDDEIIVPTWARFIHGMISSNKLRRIVSGNTLKDNKEAQALRIFIKDLIIEAFVRLRRKSEAEYSQIISPHDDAIKGSASDDSEFMECVWDKLRFPSRHRKMTVPEYISIVSRKLNKDNVVYFYDNLQQGFAANLVSDATGIPILVLDQTRDDMLIRKICAFQNLELRNFKELAEELFQQPGEDIDFSSLIRACEYSNIAAEVRSYLPDSIPAVLIEDKTMQERRDQLLRGLKEYGEDYFAKDMEKLFKRSHAANFGVSFYLNSDNLLVKKLADAPFEIQTAISLALYNISFMAAVPDLRESELKAVHISITNIMMWLLQSLESRSNIEAASDTTPKNPRQSSEITTSQETTDSELNPVTIFMITPFEDKYKVLEDVIRRVFEAHPYYFKVMLARDYTYHSGILANVGAHLNKADAFVAEISDLNPNVMMELGAAIHAGDKRPIFSLRSQDAKEGVPADIKSELFIPYISIEAPHEEIEQSVRQFLEKDGRPSHAGLVSLLESRKAKALTTTLLSSIRVKLEENEINKILSKYATVEKLLNCNAKKISDSTKLKLYVIEAVLGELKALIDE
jgi:molecular chaperone HtpG